MVVVSQRITELPPFIPDWIVYTFACGFAALFPCTDTLPTSSTVNYAAGRDIPNAAIATARGRWRLSHSCDREEIGCLWETRSK